MVVFCDDIATSSGHATVAFAAASFSREIQASHFQAARVVTPLLFSAAALVGASRLYNNKHWASDVVAGAAIGTVVGMRVVRREDKRVRRREDEKTRRREDEMRTGLSGIAGRLRDYCQLQEVGVGLIVLVKVVLHGRLPRTSLP